MTILSTALIYPFVRDTIARNRIITLIVEQRLEALENIS